MGENGDDEKAFGNKSAIDAGEGGAGEGAPRKRGPSEAELRKARNAAKLRENLMKRKAQVRARRQGEAETGTGLPASRAPEPDSQQDPDGQ